MNQIFSILLWLLAIIFPSLTLYCQEIGEKDDLILTQYLNGNGWHSEQYQISSSHTSDHNNVTYYYLQQTHDNREIYGATGVLVIKEKVIHADINNMFDSYKIDKSQTKHILSIEQVISQVAEQLKYPLSKTIPDIEKGDNRIYSRCPDGCVRRVERTS